MLRCFHQLRRVWGEIPPRAWPTAVQAAQPEHCSDWIVSSMSCRARALNSGVYFWGMFRSSLRK